MLPTSARRLLSTPLWTKPTMILQSQRFATTAPIPNKSRPPRTFQLKTAAKTTDDKPIDKPITPKVKATSSSATSIPVEAPTILDELTEFDEVPSPTRPTSTSTPSTPEKETKDKDTIKDLKSQLAQANKERNSLKQTLTLLQQECNALKEERAMVQTQLSHHTAVESIYGDAGFVQLKNMIKELAQEEASVLRSHGFDGEAIDHQLETRQKDLTITFTTQTASEMAKHINNQLKRLRDAHKQSSSAASATQQTLKNAGVPESVISGSVASLAAHIEEVQNKLSRWEKLKSDVDLLLARS